MEWIQLGYKDKEIIETYTKGKFFTCDYNFTNQLLWSKGENTYYRIENDILIIKGNYQGEEYYYMPLPRDKQPQTLVCWKEIIKDLVSKNKKIILIPEEWKKLLEDEFELIETRDSFDYIYSSNDLGTLKGRKFSKKKNKINYFKRNYEYIYEIIDETNIKEVVEFQKRWYADSKKTEVLENENIGILTLLENYFSLNLKGGVLKVNGEIIGYTIGERLTDEYAVIHVEKAINSYNGSYQMINYLFAQNELANFKYINREDDFGNEGLREAKLSYNPIMFLKKYEIIKNVKG